MGTAIEGLNRAFLKSISFIGADVIYVQRMDWFINSHEAWMRMQKRRPITLAQVRDLERQLTTIRAMAPIAETRQPINYQRRRSDGVSVVGTTDTYIQVSRAAVAQGRFLSPARPMADGPFASSGPKSPPTFSSATIRSANGSASAGAASKSSGCWKGRARSWAQ